jgi:hypothetical protein
MTLGLETALLAPASGELAEQISSGELIAMFGGDFQPEAFEAGVAMGVISPAGEDLWTIRSPRLLRAGAELVAIGIPLMEVLALGARLRERVAAVAGLFVESVAPYIVGEHEPGWVPNDEEAPRIISLVEQMRPLARVVVDEELTKALDGGISDYVAQWLTATMGQLSPPSEAS